MCAPKQNSGVPWKVKTAPNNIVLDSAPHPLKCWQDGADLLASLRYVKIHYGSGLQCGSVVFLLKGSELSSSLFDFLYIIKGLL